MEAAVGGGMGGAWGKTLGLLLVLRVSLGLEGAASVLHQSLYHGTPPKSLLLTHKVEVELTGG